MTENIEKDHSKLNEYFYMKLKIIIMVGFKVFKNKIISIWIVNSFVNGNQYINVISIQ